MSKLPLQGMRILEFGVVWAGPYCGMLLAGLGAEVIRVESLKAFVPLTRGRSAHPNWNDPKHLLSPLYAAPGRVPGDRPWNRMPLFNGHASNKLGMTVDLLQPKGQEVLRRLIAVTDVVFENSPTETMDKLGVSYETLSEMNPAIIMLRMPAYANDGYYKNHRAFGFHIEGVVGHLLQRGYADMDASTLTNTLMGDAASGTQAAFAVLAALHYRRRTGKGQLIEISQAENLISLEGEAFMDYNHEWTQPVDLGQPASFCHPGLLPLPR